MERLRKYKILLLTDSRGWHKPKGAKHLIYGERLKEDDRLEVEAYYCPFKWTTTLDLLEILKGLGAGQYQKVIMQAGIVDHSPRRQSSAINDLYDPKVGAAFNFKSKIEAGVLEKKIVNNKKKLFDGVFGGDSMGKHLGSPFDTIFEGEQTLNMYSLGMLEEYLIPVLAGIENLFLINSNAIVKGWNGDYPRKRPANISLVEDYSSLLTEHLNCLNLLQWDTKDVKKFTCDNMHLTGAGSDWIYERICEEIELKPRNYLVWKKNYSKGSGNVPWPLTKGNKQYPEQFSVDIAKAKPKKPRGKSAGKLATVIIGYMESRDDIEGRKENLLCVARRFLLFQDYFDVLVVEQGGTPTLGEDDLPSNTKMEFIYNPSDYNRGWLYNTAVRHFCKTEVVILADTDILPGKNLLELAKKCTSGALVASPYRNVFYTNKTQRKKLVQGKDVALSPTTKNLSNPVSITGGVCIFNRDYYLEIGGFEQYIGYGCEDRSLDAVVLALAAKDKVIIDNNIYAHLYHSKEGRSNFNEIYSHLVKNYGCEYTRELQFDDYLHQYCRHEPVDKLKENISARIGHAGDPLHYSKHSMLTVNGLPPSTGGDVFHIQKPADQRDDHTKKLVDYYDSENYSGTFSKAWGLAPGEIEPDFEGLEKFYNRYAGQRCFIIGNGPSLNDIDLNMIEGEYSFGVNSLYYKTKEMGFAPTFYVVEDSSVMKENIGEIKKYKAPFKFFPTIYRKLHPKEPGTYFFKMNRGFYDKTSPNYAIPRFSTDASQVLYCGQSVTFINLQLAFYMGFTEVYLVGMDFSYTIPKSHKRTGDVLLSDTDDPNHFHKDYFGKGKTWKDPKLDRVLLNYKKAKFVYETVGRKIYNATVGGHLELFERVNFLGLFNNRKFARRSSLDLKIHPVAESPRPPTGSQPSTPALETKAAPKAPARLPVHAIQQSPTKSYSIAPDLGPDRFANLLDIIRRLDMPVSNGHAFKFDTLKVNGAGGDGYTLSMKFMYLMPPFLVGDCRLKVSEKDYIYPTHKNLKRTDWSGHDPMLPDPVKLCGFKFPGFPGTGSQSLGLQVKIGEKWENVLDFRMKKKGSYFVPDLNGQVIVPSDILDGRNQLLAHYRNPNTWMPRKEFQLAGSCVHFSGVPYNAMRILSSDGQIIPMAHKVQEQAFSSLFVGKETLSSSGFVCKDKRLLRGMGSGIIQVQLLDAGTGKYGWVDLHSIRITKNILGKYKYVILL